MRDADCIAFLQWALPRLQLRWAGFRKVRRQVCKRLGRRLGELGLSDLSAYRARLERDPEEWRVLDAFCRITISRFYRDRGVFRLLGDELLGALAGRARGQGRDLRCWSAGCASGEEAYTLRIVWDLAVAPAFPGMDLAIVATDVDATMIARAQEGCYGRGSLKELPEDWILRCFEERGRRLCVRARHRAGIAFSREDIRETVPDGPFDLILCRNLAFTYFDAGLQEKTARRLADRLAPGGLLVIGAHETLPAGADMFAPLARSRAVFRRIGEGYDSD